MNGPIFISHSSDDKNEANALASALRQAFSQQIRTFNTSSGTAIQAGDNWRKAMLDAIRDASIVILWCTPAATNSKWVAFEIGAAFAYGRRIIPCAVHLAPSDLPFNLSELQAPALDTADGWLNMADAVANYLAYPGVIDRDPLIQLAKQFTASTSALQVDAIGMTIGFKNVSHAPIADLQVKPAAGEDPSWVSAVRGVALQPGQSRTLLRSEDAEDREFDVTWRDVAGVAHKQRVLVAGIRS